jgi:hypothetical protein
LGFFLISFFLCSQLQRFEPALLFRLIQLAGFYFFRFVLLTFLAAFAFAGGGVVAKRLIACSNVIPFTRKSIAFGIKHTQACASRSLASLGTPNGAKFFNFLQGVYCFLRW